MFQPTRSDPGEITSTQAGKTAVRRQPSASPGWREGGDALPRRHTVRQGDCIASIAGEYGFFPDTIWNHSDNASLKAQRQDGYMLVPGDVVIIPDLRPGQESGATAKKHRFRRKGVPEMLRLVIRDEEDQPRANLPYLLTIDGEHREGSTDADGRIQEPIPPRAKLAKLRVGPEEEGLEYELQLGGMDPISETTGVQARLHNLGYDVGPADGELGERGQKALEEFQYEHALEPTGRLDDATRHKLEEIHDQAS
jgi:hypothetical protein